jgi:predicted nucleic acid-binding Zn ribbon protein
MTELPSRHDDVTTACPVCHNPFTPAGRRRFCSDACRATAYRRRRDASHQPVVVPDRRPRRQITVYECGTCANRALGQQHCNDCSTFMTRIGIGGTCPSYDEPITIRDLLDQGGDNHHDMT